MGGLAARNRAGPCWRGRRTYSFQLIQIPAFLIWNLDKLVLRLENKSE